MTVLEDPFRDAERGGDRGEVGDHADERHQRAAQRDEQQQESEPDEQPEHQRRAGGQNLFQVVVFRRSTADSEPFGSSDGAGRSLSRWPD